MQEEKIYFFHHTFLGCQGLFHFCELVFCCKTLKLRKQAMRDTDIEAINPDPSMALGTSMKPRASQIKCNLPVISPLY